MSPRKTSPTPHVHYHKDGSVYARGELTEGVMTGHWEFFRKDGSVMRSGSFEGGEQVGEWKTYDRAGRLVKSTTMSTKKKGKKTKRAG